MAVGFGLMVHYVAIVEEEPNKAVGVWFPDLPGCFSAGDSIEEAMSNARDALVTWADVVRLGGQRMPVPRTILELRADPETASEIQAYLVALIPLDEAMHAAA